MTFPTKIIDLAGGPVNLMADPDVAAAIACEPAEYGARIFVQNISPRSKAFFAERSAAPARTDRGHCLFVGDGFVLRLTSSVTPGAWVWAASTGTVAVSPAHG